ncbi:MAG: T9SS type A sorting domain-containing protein, partial [Flavobacteriales bacterium]|nr:T9SS type A sorting domain-containing protein [Flavobacteriales bacterium]
GMITGTFSGGTGMIMFDMDPDFMTPACFPDYANLGPGTYSVYAMDENGCEVQSNTVTLTNPAVLNLSLQASADATCSDSDDGQLVMFATGGTGDKDYGTDGITYQEGAVLHLAGGDYLIYVIDENGCTDTLSATVNAPDPISILPTITDVLCAGDTNGVVNTLASGGNGGFTYSFEGGNFSTLHNWTNLAPGEYMVDVMDNEDCAAQLMVTVGEPDELMADVAVNDISCFGEEDGAFEIMATGGTPMYMYGLDTLVTDTDPMYGDFGAGTIAYYVMDANGCMTMGEATITEPEELTVTIDASDNQYEGGNGGFIDITIEGGTGNYDISWTSDQGFSSSDEDISDLSGPATYTVTITDENGCSTSTEQVIDFIVGVQEIFNNVAFSAVPNPTNGTFFLNISGLNNQKVAYTLTDVSGRMVAGEELNTLSGEYRTEINITDAASGMYYLTLTVADQSSTIKVIKQK